MCTQFILGVPEMDEQHARWLRLANAIRNRVSIQPGHDQNSAAAARALDELIAYTGEHFSAEEALMEQDAYPGLSAHRTAHGEITRALERLRGEAGQKGRSTPIKLHFLLTIWLMEHIATIDAQYATFKTARPANTFRPTSADSLVAAPG